MFSPCLSVILPTHNRVATLGRAICSVLGQSFRDLELIVIDDGSTDETGKLLAGINDPRIRVVHQAQRQGAAHARNEGIRASRSHLIAFQDSDDEWLPGKLELQLAVLESNPDVGWVGGAYLVGHGLQWREVRSLELERGKGYQDVLFVGTPFVTPTWLVRRDLVLAAGLFDESMPCLEDWDLIFKLADVCRFRAVPEPILIRHGSADSLFGDVTKRRQGMEVMLTRHRRRWEGAPGSYAKWCTELARLYGLTGEGEASRKWLRRALALKPLQLRAAGLYVAAALGDAPLKRLSESRFAAFN